MTITPIAITRIRFPEIKLATRDAHKLRGYFGNLFKEHSPLLHNHFQDGSLRYRYPLVQYKVIDKVPMLVGLNEGAELLPKLFLKMKKIEIDDQQYTISSKNIEAKVVEIGVSEVLNRYEFKTLWMALNQENFKKYQQFQNDSKKTDMLNRIMIGHILGFFSNMDLRVEQQIMCSIDIKEKTTNFKGQKMLAFVGQFVANVDLPDFIGLGKSSARGFGTIQKIS